MYEIGAEFAIMNLTQNEQVVSNMNKELKVWSELQTLNDNLDNSDRIRLESNFPPEKGWIAFIRTSLGMSRKNLATHMGVKISTIIRDERRESLGKIKLTELEEYAKPLFCQLKWIILTDQSLCESHIESEMKDWSINQISETLVNQGCQFIYVLAPKMQIEKIRKRQAARVAITVLNNANELMILENQEVPRNTIRELKKQFTEEILKRPTGKLWVLVK